MIHYFIRAFKLLNTRIIAFFLMGFFLSITIVLIPCVIGAWIKGVFSYIRSGEQMSFKELLNFDHYFEIAFLFFIGGFLICIAYSLLVLPGILLSVWWLYALLICVDQKRCVSDSLSISKELVTKNGFGRHLGLFLILVILNFLGAFFVIGPLVTIPISLLFMTLNYLGIVEPLEECNHD